MNLPELYSESRDAAYHYRHGTNLRAVAAFIPSALIAIVLALVPAFESLSQFSWFFGAGLGGLIHYAIANRRTEHLDVSGEAIAVDSVHH
ncbi:allantoin permease [compost metagenome]